MYETLNSYESERELLASEYDLPILHNNKIVYSDKYVDIYGDRIVIHKYYFPTLKDRVIYFSQIQSLKTNKELKLHFFDYRSWGYGLNDIWWAVDVTRDLVLDKPLCFVATVVGEWSKKGFTVERPQECLSALNQLLPGPRQAFPIKNKNRRRIKKE